MTTLTELKKQLEVISDILIYSRNLATNGCSMRASDNTTHIVIKRNKFLKGLANMFYELSVIELAKLFSKGPMHHYSIINLLKLLENNYNSAEWINKISIAEIKRLKSSLEIEPIIRKIENLKSLRNQHYAHTDQNRESRYIDLYYEDISDLIITGEGIINELSTKILNKPLQFAQYNGEDVKAFFIEYLENIKLAGLYNLGKSKTALGRIK